MKIHTLPTPPFATPSEPPVVIFHQIQKMQVFSALVGGVAHDYNNLLSIFHGYTEILQMGIDPGNPLQQYLTEMMGAVERAKTLTAQLLNFSRATASAPRELRVEKLVRDFHKMLRRMAPENIELVTELEEESGWVMADPRQIETLLSNLVLNACEAMPQGGRLCIELRDAVVTPGSRPAQEGLAPGSYLRLAVSDTGVGIPIDLISRIFEPSFTSNPPGCNLGLGLFLSTEIVEQNGGKILVESTPGQGSTFEVFLRQIPPPQEPAAKPLPEVSFGKGENILIVEDDGPARKTLATMVSQLGYQAICAANGDEALGILERKNEIRLVIADMVMPLLGGIRMAEIMRQRWPEIKIILTSGYAVEPPNKTMVFLPKPIPRGALIQNIRKLLDA